MYCAGEVTQWVKALANKPDDFSSVPRIHMGEGENLTPTSCPISMLWVHSGAPPPHPLSLSRASH